MPTNFQTSKLAVSRALFWCCKCCSTVWTARGAGRWGGATGQKERTDLNRHHLGTELSLRGPLTIFSLGPQEVLVLEALWTSRAQPLLNGIFLVHPRWTGTALSRQCACDCAFKAHSSFTLGGRARTCHASARVALRSVICSFSSSKRVERGEARWPSGRGRQAIRCIAPCLSGAQPRPSRTKRKEVLQGMPQTTHPRLSWEALLRGPVAVSGVQKGYKQ